MPRQVMWATYADLPVHHHVVAWTSAFHDAGRHVASTAVHHAIGMGGDRLVSQVAGAAAESAVGNDVRALHDKYFRAGLRTITELDGAADLVEAAVSRVGPGRAIVVGDAVWDAPSADAAGLPCIGLGSGGIDASHLRAAGATAVYDGPRGGGSALCGVGRG